MDGGLGSDQDFFPEKWSDVIGLTPPHEVKHEKCQQKKTWFQTSKRNNGFDCESLVLGTSVSSIGKVIELQNCESSGHDRSTVGSSKHSLELRWCLVGQMVFLTYLDIDLMNTWMNDPCGLMTDSIKESVGVSGENSWKRCSMVDNDSFYHAVFSEARKVDRNILPALKLP